MLSPLSTLDALLFNLADKVVSVVEQLSFWTAIALPALYVPLLVVGLDSTGDVAAFAGLLLANVLALALGARHDP